MPKTPRSDLVATGFLGAGPIYHKDGRLSKDVIENLYMDDWDERVDVVTRGVLGLTVALASGELLSLRRPEVEKNTVGYLAAQDPVDWFVGSEGTLGVIVEAELALLPRPDREVGFAVPCPNEGAGVDIV